MNIINKIIDDIARSMIMDKEDREKLHLIVQLCKSSGVVSIMEFRQLTSLGIPIARILVTILRIPNEAVANLCTDGKITYEDLLCILSIFAQDLLVRKQIRNGYNG